jgi:hypothetical protein
MKKTKKAQDQFVMIRRAMLESPAWRVLSLTARCILDRIMLEHMKHGGKDNGKLPVTYADFKAYGIDPHAVGPGNRELVALGLMKIEHGKAGIAGQSRPNRVRL